LVSLNRLPPTGVFSPQGLVIDIYSPRERRMHSVSDDKAKLSSDVQRILSQFPRPVTLSEDRLTGLSFGLVALMFAAIGALLFTTKSNQQSRLALSAAIVFFGGCAIQILISFLPGHGQLRLDSEGMIINYGFFRWKHQWADVTDISLCPPWGQCVTFNGRASANTFFGRLNKLFGPTNSFIPNLYGLSPDEMMQLLSLWQTRALRLDPNVR
jgi:hypothetical protein